MRKIGLVSEYFYPHLGGITEHVTCYAKELLQRGFDVTLFTGYEGEAPGIEPPEGLHIIRLGKSVPVFSNHSFAKITLGWNLGAKIRYHLETGNFDLLHIHAATLPVLPVLFQKYSRTITVGTLHTYFESSVFYRIARGVSQRYLDALDGVIAVAPSCIEAMGRYFDFKHGYRIIPNGVDIDWFSRPTGLLQKYADRRPTVLFLGRLDPRNGLDTLLDAFPLLLRKMPDARLIVVGDGPLRTWYEQQAGTLLGHSVFFEGQIGDLRPDYFSRCDVFCYPATKASFGITLLEAMAAGKPVVAADNCGFRELIAHGKTGLLVAPNDRSALSKALLSILQNPTLAQALATHAQNGIRSFSWPAVTDQILSYYDEIYRQKKGVPFAA